MDVMNVLRTGCVWPAGQVGLVNCCLPQLAESQRNSPENGDFRRLRGCNLVAEMLGLSNQGVWRMNGLIMGAAGVLVLALGMVGAVAVKAEAPATKDIVDTAVGAGKFNTLVAAVKAAGLVDTLKGNGPFTVFAPTDEAFAQIPKAKLEALLKDKSALTAVLTYHVVPGKVMAADVVKLDSAKTVQGKPLAIVVKDGTVTINGVKVVKTDIVCTNGVIHVIDAVLLPPE